MDNMKRGAGFLGILELSTFIAMALGISGILMAQTGYTPKMPPMQSDPKRDAAPPADAATKSEIKSKLQAQLAATAARPARSAGAALAPAEKPPEIQALQSQKMFVDSLRSQGALTKKPSLPPQAPVPPQAPNVV